MALWRLNEHELIVQSAAQQIYRFLKADNSIPRYVKDQLARASLSIMPDIAEGSAEFSNKDKRSYYVTPSGSVPECAPLVIFLYNEPEISNKFKTEIIYNL